MPDDAQLLEHVIARNLRDLRAERGWSQAQLATYMRASGFTWQTNRVTQLETLRRPVSLLELLGLAWAFGVPVARLLDGDDAVSLPSGDSVPLAAVRQALTGGQGQTVTPPPTGQRLQELQDTKDDLRKIAQGLGIPVDVLGPVCRELWGRSLVAEREARLGDVAGLSAASVRTHRGHVTRALVSELDARLGTEQERARLVDEHNRRARAYLRGIQEKRQQS